MPATSPEAKEHFRKYAAQWYQDNIERERQRRKTYSHTYRRKHPKKRILAGAKQRAKQSNLPFDIDENDFEIPTYCPILGCKLTVGKKMFAPSLDRIIPDLGYVKGNIWIISLKANVMKNNATPQELQNFAQWVLNGSKTS